MSSDFDTTIQEYVEIIYEIQKDQKVARVKDIAQRRGVTRSSVSTVLNVLRHNDLIHHESYGLVELTEKGRLLGEQLEERHQVIENFLTDILSVNDLIASKDACVLEHYISPEVLDSLVNFISFIKDYPDCLEQFKRSEEREQP